MIENFKNKIKNKGFTLLFASLIVSLLLAVGLAILSITLQSLTLSSAGRESQFAFYNADSGAECALFFDIKHPDNGKFFATSTLSTSDPNSYKQNDSIVCDTLSGHAVGTIISVTTDLINANLATTTFDFIMDTTSCPAPNQAETYRVAVGKYINSQGLSATKIESRGYNTCDSSNLRRVERGLEVNY